MRRFQSCASIVGKPKYYLIIIAYTYITYLLVFY